MPGATALRSSGRPAASSASQAPVAASAAAAAAAGLPAESQAVPPANTGRVGLVGVGRQGGCVRAVDQDFPRRVSRHACSIRAAMCPALPTYPPGVKGMEPMRPRTNSRVPCRAAMGRRASARRSAASCRGGASSGPAGERAPSAAAWPAHAERWWLAAPCRARHTHPPSAPPAQCTHLRVVAGRLCQEHFAEAQRRPRARPRALRVPARQAVGQQRLHGGARGRGVGPQRGPHVARLPAQPCDSSPSGSG